MLYNKEQVFKGLINNFAGRLLETIGIRDKSKKIKYRSIHRIINELMN